MESLVYVHVSPNSLKIPLITICANLVITLALNAQAQMKGNVSTALPQNSG